MFRTTSFNLSLIVLPLGLLATPTAAAPLTHVPSFTFQGDTAGDDFGFSASGAGDVNGDGFDDLIVGAPGDDNNDLDSGSARVFSGDSGAALYTFDGDSGGDFFGGSASGAGDVNGDGFADLIVGARFDDNNGDNSGSARVLSGNDGSELFEFNGDDASDEFGVSVSGAGDVDGDGFADLIVGARFDDNNGDNSGSARVFSGNGGGLLHEFNGDDAFDEFGVSVSGAGDVNDDGFADLIIGAPFDDNNGGSSGSARVFSGNGGGELYEFNGDAGEEFGESVSGAGDVNGDGFDDLIVGASFTSDNGFLSGSARVLSGNDGTELFEFNGDDAGDQLGFSVSGAGDVNGDGFDDLIVGAYFDDNNGFDSGSVRILSGDGGGELYEFNGDDAFDQFGRSVSGAGDVNGDGVADFIVGALDVDVINDEGYARVFVSIPEPATLVLLSLGGLFFMANRPRRAYRGPESDPAIPHLGKSISSTNVGRTHHACYAEANSRGDGSHCFARFFHRGRHAHRFGVPH